MSQSAITLAFENYKAQEATNGQVLKLNEFVLANVPGLDPSLPVDRNETVPSDEYIVHRQAVSKEGVVNQNTVAYSITMGSDVGDFDFNWLGLRNKETGLLGMVVHVPTQKKIATAAGQQGNALTRSFLMEYDGAAEATGITTPAESWQIDFTARLFGIDDVQRLINRDLYGAGAFFGDSFLVTKSGSVYSVTAGVGYIGGLRAELSQNQTVNANSLPTKIWADVSYQGTVTSDWQTVISLMPAETMVDYVDAAGFAHYVFAVAAIDSTGAVTDLRPKGSVPEQELQDAINNLNDALAKHEKSRNHPDASLTEKGFVQLSSATDSTSETLAATPKAVKTVHDLAAGKYTAEDATTAKRGLVQLSSETDSTSETLAATPKAVKTVHDLAASKAPVNSPALTGHPTAPTPVDSAAGQEIATAAFVVAKIAKLVNSSPAALDTLQELAAALGNDPNFSATVMNLIGQKLSKDQNGADIPNIHAFVANIGACRAQGAKLSTGGGTWSTAQFIQWLKSAGAFEHPYWMCKTSWGYAVNKVITDTGCGNICLAGVVIEVMGTEEAMTIRITTPTTTSGGGVPNAQFTYINHGDDYSPGWRRDFNTANPQSPQPYSHTHTAAQGNHDVISGAWNAVGATVLARLTGGGACAPGGRVYGSSLLVSSASSYAGGGLPGTWQCQGQAFANGSYVELQVTTWIRVA
ncbi:phage tail protein [Plesiomonas shigelloides]|uniref:tail fiber protein n=1 Tax=Plesiomonas shigelloides TaxID=703 RepID=UPI001261732F|nr:tail fiber protein [Plesiomonas shigelloides]KAB7698806.1 phage tail protein [Plesiomonas shigelloides]